MGRPRVLCRAIAVCPTAGGGKLSFVMLLASLLIIPVAYLPGSSPVGYLLVRIFLKQDVRSVGSGNIGATNVLRSGGKGLGAATFLGDVLKGCAAVWLGMWFAANFAPWAVPRNFEAVGAVFAV